MNARILALTLPLCFLAAGHAQAAFAQDPAPEQEPQDGQPQDVVRLDAWPELPKSSPLKKEIARLRKGSSETMIEESSAALNELGAAAAPALIATLGSSTLKGERHDEAAVRVAGVLDTITAAPHTRLIAAEFAHKSPRVRDWALRRAAALPDPGTAQAAEAALAAAREKPDKEFPETPYLASTACLAAGSLAGLELIVERAKDDWGDVGHSLRKALEGVRGDDATSKVVAQMKDNDRSTNVACLRLLAGCGTKAALSHVKPHLKGSDNSLRIAAINTCRGIVDGDPPLDRLSAFQAIEMAKSWAECI